MEMLQFLLYTEVDLLNLLLASQQDMEVSSLIYINSLPFAFSLLMQRRLLHEIKESMFYLGFLFFSLIISFRVIGLKLFALAASLNHRFERVVEGGN